MRPSDGINRSGIIYYRGSNPQEKNCALDVLLHTNYGTLLDKKLGKYSNLMFTIPTYLYFWPNPRNEPLLCTVMFLITW